MTWPNFSEVCLQKQSLGSSEGRVKEEIIGEREERRAVNKGTLWAVQFFLGILWSLFFLGVAKEDNTQSIIILKVI